MNIKEVVDSGRYKIFSRMGEENREKQIMIVNYIEQLASSTGINIDDWNIMEVFGTGTGNSLVTDKRAINRILFNKFKDRSVEEKPAGAGTVAPEAQQAINNLAETILNERKRELSDRLANCLGSTEERYRRYLRALSDAVKINMELAAMSTGTGPDISKEIETICATDFWNFEKATGNKITFVTAQDVVNTHKRPSAGLDISVNLGKFRATYDVECGNIRVEPAGNNIWHREYTHPHISAEGSICWGNAGSTANNMLAAFKIADAFNLLASLLVTYSHENPYADLGSFYEKYQEARKGGRPVGESDRPPTPEGDCGNCGADNSHFNYCYEDEEWFCGSCEETI